VNLLFEYGIEDMVEVSKQLYSPFRPSIYETPNEQVMLTFDIVRLCINIGLAAICVGINIQNIISNWNSNKKNYDMSAVVEMFILANFSAQVYYLFGATPTAELLAQKN
jgi:hypothetical protein